MTFERIALAPLLALSLALSACAARDDLHGSLGEAYPLHFEHVRARLQDSGLAIEYVDVHGAVPVRVSLRRGVVPVAGGRYDLALEGDVTGETHDGLGILRFSKGELELDEFRAEEGARVTGRFDVDFPIDERVLSLHGEFSAPIDLVGWTVPSDDAASDADATSEDAPETETP